jgi:tetratricopeptide (TPR) repeat protein
MRYVSPEAARREELGQGADVFALSLIIRELIEGIPARRGSGDELAMEAVDGRVSNPHGLEGELASLAPLAASPHPENRPTASQFAAALKGSAQFKGFAKQDWLIIGVALAAILMLAFMLRESTRERARSTQQFEDARAAFEGFLGGIYPELDRVESIAPLAEAGRRALASMEVMTEEERTPRDRQLLARTLLWNAEAERVQGDTEASQELFAQAVDRAKDLDDPGVASSIILDAETSLGELAVANRDVVRASKHFQNAMNIGRTQLNEEPDSRDNRIEFARALIGAGTLRMSSGSTNADRAMSIFGRARSVLSHSSVTVNEFDRDALDLNVRLNNLEASVAFIKGDVSRAIQLLQRHVDGAKRLVEMDPGRPRLRQVAAKGGGILGLAQREAARLDDAVVTLRDTVEGWRLLRAMEPDEIRWRREWARATRELAEVLSDVGEWQEAALLHETSLEDLSMLLSTGQLPAGAELEVGEQLLDATEGLHAAGDLVGARKRLAEARDRLGAVAPSPRQETQWRTAVAHADVIYAELLLSEGSWEAAELSALNFLDTVDDFAVDGQDRLLRVERARALLITSAVRAMQGESEVATGARERALGIAEELVREEPRFVRGHVLKARTHFDLGQDEEAAAVLADLEEMGYRGLDLGPVRVATAALRD